MRKISNIEIDGKNSNMKTSELTVIRPIILVINGIDDEILIEMETIAPISVRTIDNLINELN